MDGRVEWIEVVELSGRKTIVGGKIVSLLIKALTPTEVGRRNGGQLSNLAALGCPGIALGVSAKPAKPWLSGSRSRGLLPIFTSNAANRLSTRQLQCSSVQFSAAQRHVLYNT